VPFKTSWPSTRTFSSRPGYYTAVSMTLNVAEVPVPPGEKNPLEPPPQGV
jgi:hypothetical protein